MNIPDKVKVGGHIMEVVITNDNELIGSNEIGKTTLAKNIIYLNPKYPKSQQEEALLHEIVHNWLYDLCEEQDEKLVTRLGFLLHALVIDNPGVFMYEPQT